MTTEAQKCYTRMQREKSKWTYERAVRVLGDDERSLHKLMCLKVLCSGSKRVKRTPVVDELVALIREREVPCSTTVE